MYIDLGFGHKDVYYEGDHVDKYMRCYLPQQPSLRDIQGANLPTKEQKWKRTPLPEEWKNWRREEAKYLKTDTDYYHPKIEAFVEQEWNRRLNGHWFMNNGNPTYMTGSHYFFCNWWMMDIGYPDFRDSDIDYYYYRQVCIEDTNSLGMIQIAMRRDGKSYKGGEFLFEPTSRTKSAASGIQSKTDTDAYDLYEKCVLKPFKHLPDFFKPNFDTTAGTSPKKGLNFVNASKKGKAALDDYDSDDELESKIDYKSSVEKAYDGQKLFRYLSDECGKTVGVNVWNRHEVVRFCSTLNAGATIVGKQLHTTTVEELDKGGEAFKKLWFESDPDVKNANGQTNSGLYRFFTPACKSMFLDEYGIADVDKAKEYLTNAIDGLSNANDRASFKRKNPQSVEEAFYSDVNSCAFNAGILNDRLAYLNSHERSISGDFHWKDGIVDSEVVFIPDSNSKKWQVTTLPGYQDANRITKMFDEVYQKNLFAPMNDAVHRMAVDPIDHASAITSSRKLSKASISVFRQFDPSIDNYQEVDFIGRPIDTKDKFGKVSSSWKTYNFIALYLFRPEEPLEFYEDVIKACMFFGCKVLIENQKPGLINHMMSRGYANFLMNRPKETYTVSNGKWGTDQDKVGSPASKLMTDHYTGLLKSFVSFHGHRIDFKDLITQLLEFRPDKPTEYDAVVSAGNALVASKATVIVPKFELATEDYFRTYKRR
jgi:hypothetical protein